jgi:heat-inducible transcriptional repressor
MAMEELGARHREILKAIIQEHIASGEPVGSSAIAGREVAVSPATVRAVMADLEELGFLEKPHTSAGRIPTQQGYRYYVDALIQLRPPTRAERELIDSRLPQGGAAEELLREGSKLLSSLSRQAAVVTTPAVGAIHWERIELVRLKENRVLAVLLSTSGLVRNRLLTLDFPMTASELADAACRLTEMLREGPLETVRERILEQLQQARSEYDALASKTLRLGQRVFEGAQENGVLIEGQERFFEAPEFADAHRMRELFRALEERTKLLAVLDRTLSAS